ncbi:hypothetical protein ABKN59_011220 [Abortiporus biennis]
MDVRVPGDNSTEPFDEVIDSILEDIFHRNGWMDISVSLGVNIICGEIFAWEFLAHELKALVRAQFKEMYDENRHWIDPNFSICRFISDLLRYEDFSQQFGDVVRVVMESLFRHDGWTMTDPTFPMSNIINVLNLASSRRYRSGMIYQWTIFFRYNKRIYTEFQWRIQSKARFPRLPPEILEFVVNFVGASEWDAHSKYLGDMILPFHRHLRVIAIHWTSDGFELHKRYPELSIGFEVLPALERLILYLDKDGSDIYDFSTILSRSSSSSTLSSICFLIMENGSNYNFRNLKILDRELA